MAWHVYMILCSDQSLYTGITNDPERRWIQHATRRGARYLRARTPVCLVYLEGGHTRSSASRREAAIKKLRRAAKRALIDSEQNLAAVPPVPPTCPAAREQAHES